LVILAASVAILLPFKSCMDWISEFSGTAITQRAGRKLAFGIHEFGDFNNLDVIFENPVLSGNPDI